MGHHPASTNTMIIEVLALRIPSPWDASDSSAGDVFAETSALESDAHQHECPRRAKTSENIAFGFAGGGPKVSLTAPGRRPSGQDPPNATYKEFSSF